MVVSAKRLAQMAKEWHRMAVVGRKRLAWATMSMAKGAADECCTLSVAGKGRQGPLCRWRQFEIPLLCRGTVVFSDLLSMSEEFGFTGSNGGQITLPCDGAVMEYAMCLFRRNASAEVGKAFLSSMVRPCHFDVNGVVPPCVGINRQVAAC